MADWGAFLDTRLYTEALSALGGAMESRLPITCDGMELRTHPVDLIGSNVGFCVTAFTDSLDHQRAHLQTLLGCLPLRALQWTNFNHAALECVTLINEVGNGRKSRIG